MQKVILSYKKIIAKIAQICGLIGAVGLGGLMLMTVSDVFLRYFFNKPILGSFELTEYLLVPISICAIAWATHQRVNVKVDLIVGKFRTKLRAKIYAVACVLAIYIAFIIAWFTIPQAMYIFDIYIESDMLGIPAYPFYIIIAIGFAILFFILIANLIEFIEEATAK